MPYSDLVPGTTVYHCIAAEYALAHGTVRSAQDVAGLNDHDRDVAGKDGSRFWTQGGGKYVGDSIETALKEHRKHILKADPSFANIRIRFASFRIYPMNIASATSLVSVCDENSHCLTQLSNRPTTVNDLLAENDYRASQDFATSIGRIGFSGLEWPSVARMGGKTMFVFDLRGIINDVNNESVLVEHI